MPAPDSDPRVFFAAERTLLAWLRTGIAVIGLGFVVSRFGLFLQMLVSGGAPMRTTHVAAALGIAFVVAGSLLIAVAVAQHRRFIASLPQRDLPSGYSLAMASWFSVFIAALGLLLAVYLALTNPGA